MGGAFGKDSTLLTSNSNIVGALIPATAMEPLITLAYIELS